MPMYRVTREFIGGLLDGIIHTEVTRVKFEVGFISVNPIGGSTYKIIKVEEIEG